MAFGGGGVIIIINSHQQPVTTATQIICAHMGGKLLEMCAISYQNGVGYCTSGNPTCKLQYLGQNLFGVVLNRGSSRPCSAVMVLLLGCVVVVTWQVPVMRACTFVGRDSIKLPAAGGGYWGHCDSDWLAVSSLTPDCLATEPTVSFLLASLRWPGTEPGSHLRLA